MAKYIQSAIKSIERQIAEYQSKADKEKDKEEAAKVAGEYWLSQIGPLKEQIKALSPAENYPELQDEKDPDYLPRV